MFFEEADDIYDIIESEDPALSADQIRKVALAAEAEGRVASPVVAIAPREGVDQRKNLHVMPILDFDEASFDNGTLVTLLKVAVASVKPGSKLKIDPPVAAPQSERDEYRAGVVFVVDTIISMERYIRGTQKALAGVYQQIEKSGNADAVAFGLIGFRDSLEAKNTLGYDVRTYVPLSNGFKKSVFLNGISQMTEAPTTSRNFREDSYAGIEHAIDSMDWKGFNARFIILVTDASPREANDAYSATGLSAEGIKRIAREQIDARVAVMHLRTPRGNKDHRRAETAYKQLTKHDNDPPLYFPIENGNSTIYQETAQEVGQLLVDQVTSFRLGEDTVDFSDDTAGKSPTSVLRSAGRTMQLKFLGRKRNTQAPDVFDAVIADKDFNRPGASPVSIRLLVNKAELSDLNEALEVIVEQAELNIAEPAQFFNKVLLTAARMGRQPDKVSNTQDTTLASAVAINELLDGLPYQSQIMNVTQDDWIRMGISEQQTIVNAIYEKLERYKRYNSATDHWVDYLGRGAAAKNLVYPMRLDDLP